MNDGECDWCDGSGEVLDFPEPSLPYGHYVACQFCGGTGSAPRGGAAGESGHAPTFQKKPVE